MAATIRYAREDEISFAEYHSVLQASSLAERRPTDPDRLRKMLMSSNLKITARDQDGKLVGLARCMTDHGHMCYVCDLATIQDLQGRGVGKYLMAKVKELLGPEVMMLLLSAPKAESFYEHIGMERSERAFTSVREV